MYFLNQIQMKHGLFLDVALASVSVVKLYEKMREWVSVSVVLQNVPALLYWFSTVCCLCKYLGVFCLFLVSWA